MLSVRRKILLFTFVCLVATALVIYFFSGIDPEKIQHWLKHAGIWAPIIYVVLYVVATTLMLPSTALNLSGGAIFGLWIGILWTSVGALLAAVVTFMFTRTIGRDMGKKRFAKQWQVMDAELCRGGLLYIFAIRLLPIIPNGVVNFSAGLTSISFKDYFIGTCLGTVPGILPFVMLGSSGVTAIKTGDVFPVIGALLLLSCLTLAAAWYRRGIVLKPRSATSIKLERSRHKR